MREFASAPLVLEGGQQKDRVQPLGGWVQEFVYRDHGGASSLQTMGRYGSSRSVPFHPRLAKPRTYSRGDVMRIGNSSNGGSVPTSNPRATPSISAAKLFCN